MKKSFCYNFMLLAAFSLFLGNSTQCLARTLKVGVIFDGPSESSLSFIENIKGEIPKVISDRYYNISGRGGDEVAPAG